MIISASRRTDIPAFYSEWFIRRIRAGYCEVVNPFNRRQISRISLLPQEVDAIVFWTRQPRPLFPYLDELDRLAYRYYFQYTVLDYPHEFETSTPSLNTALQTFRELSKRLSPAHVIWRYDPVVFSNITPPTYHASRFHVIASALEGYTSRVVFSLMDFYPKLKSRLRLLEKQGVSLDPSSVLPEELAGMLYQFAADAGQHGMEIATCSELADLSAFGIEHGSCIDLNLIYSLFGVKVNAQKDPCQRTACGCAVSKDIGAYESCMFGCQYCYAVQSFARSRENYLNHDPEASTLIDFQKGLEGENSRKQADHS